MDALSAATPLETDPRAVAGEAISRIAEADALLRSLETGINKYGPSLPNPEYVDLADGRRVSARVARDHVAHLLRTAEMLTELAKALGGTSGSGRKSA